MRSAAAKAIDAAKRRRRYRLRKAQGRCTNCGQPAEGWGCAACKQKQATSAYQQVRRPLQLRDGDGEILGYWDRRQNGTRHYALGWALMEHRLRMECQL